MTRKWKTRLWTLSLAAAWLWSAGSAQAAVGTPSHLNINVTVTQSLSVAVDDAASSTYTVTWNTQDVNKKLVSPSTATVTNDSGAQTERWQLSTNANSINTAGNTDTWTLATTTSTLPGTEAFTLQAVFGSSNTVAGGCPLDTSTDWEQEYAQPITSVVQTYGALSNGEELFVADSGDTVLNNEGTPAPDDTTPQLGEMLAGSKRALCWRAIMPASTVISDTQNIQIIVTALAPQ